MGLKKVLFALLVMLSRGKIQPSVQVLKQHFLQSLFLQSDNSSQNMTSVYTACLKT